MKNSEPYVITISRMLGSGGAYIGQLLAKKLNIIYVDREIVSEAAKEFQVSEETIEGQDERTASLWDFIFQASMVINQTSYIPPKLVLPTEKILFDAEAEIIKRIAYKQPAVIIGRGGSHILRDHPRHISVFLHGDKDFRKSRIQKLYDLDEKTALKKITENDKRRSGFCKTFTGHEFADSRQYDICLDTSKIGIDESAEIILKYAEQRFGLETFSPSQF